MMTEANWLAWGTPHWLLSFIADPHPVLASEQSVTILTERRLRLFLVGCCRRQWDLFCDPICKRAVEVAERYADGLATEGDLEAASRDAQDLGDRIRMEERPWPNDHSLRQHIANAAIMVGWSYAELTRPKRLDGAVPPEAACPRGVRGLTADRCLDEVARALDWLSADRRARTQQDATEEATQAALLRCIAGNPFRPVIFSPEWRTETAVLLARQMYESRDFSLMPILADALQDAGCEDEQILSHCRDPQGTHVRGCWVVDWVLGKE